MTKVRRTRIALLVLGVLTLAATASAAPALASAPFELTSFQQSSTNLDGSPATQAGSLPYESGISFTVSKEASGSSFRATGVVKGFAVDLPPGLVGNPDAAPKCARAEFELRLSADGNPVCPSDTQVGVALVTLEEGLAVQLPIFNLAPPEGVAAQFGIASSKFVAFLDAGVSVNPGGEYVVSLDAEDIESQGFVGLDISLWGDPADPSHNALRVYPGQDEAGVGPHGELIPPIPSDVSPKPFLRLATNCLLPQPLSLSADSREAPLTVVSLRGKQPGGVGGLLDARLQPLDRSDAGNLGDGYPDRTRNESSGSPERRPGRSCGGAREGCRDDAPAGFDADALDDERPGNVLARADRDRLDPGNGTPPGVPGGVERGIPGSDHAPV